jgi:hypothetical protein
VKASTGPKVGSQPNTVFEGSPPTSSVIKLFKTHSTQVNHDNRTRDNDLDFGIMETSFHDKVLTQECAHKDDMGDITQNMSVLAVGPDEGEFRVQMIAFSNDSFRRQIEQRHI